MSGTDTIPFELLSKILRAHPGISKALDLGCGAGRSSAFLEDLGFSVTAVDKNPFMCERARERVRDARVITADAQQLRLDSGTFDLVFSSWMLVEISTQLQMQSIFTEAFRLLRDGGVFVFIVNTAEFYRGRWVSNDVDFPENVGELTSGAPVRTGLIGQGIVVDDFFWKESDYRELAIVTGFDIERVERPTASVSDSQVWFDELVVPPYAVFFCRRGDSRDTLANVLLPVFPKSTV